MDSPARAGEEAGLGGGDATIDNGTAETLPILPPVNPDGSLNITDVDTGSLYGEDGLSNNSHMALERSDEPSSTIAGEPSDNDPEPGTNEEAFPTLGELEASTWAEPPTYEPRERRQQTFRHESDYINSHLPESSGVMARESRRSSNFSSQASLRQASAASSRSRNGSRVSRSTEDGNDTSIRASNLRSTLDALEGLSFSGGSGEPSRNPTNDRGYPRRTSSARRTPSRSPPTEIVIPRWQPDAEVTFCPICKTQFSFFVRKHHCRKCGRVVCNACSPHRITIPYQYIVQPPNDGITTALVLEGHLPSNSRNSGVPIGYSGLGGGARVRLCNPCVPDPNIAPPQTPQPSARLHPSGQVGYHSRATSSANVFYGNYGSREAPGTRSPYEASSTQNRSTIFGTRGSQTSLEDTIRRLYGVDQTSDEDRNFSAHRSRTAPRPARNSSRSAYSFASTGPSLNASNLNTSQPHYRSLIDDSQRPLPPVPRIAEEDECPVCHQELPSRTLPNFEALREDHIKECVEQRLAASSGHATRPAAGNSIAQAFNTPLSSSNPTNSSLAAPPQPSHDPGRRRGASSAASQASSSTAAPSTYESRAAARERAHAAVVLGASRSPQGRRSGVFPYKATEKDCIDDAECTICMEEYEVGEEMGRLECFCRYHLHCIQGWFESHPGQCPVHGMDG
ncbi:FYVE zinc finger-domain-containing protein [Xylogone sp. PMI_703]|nr:FYVE zinc finger-domain-containing protein [Xylogone sp. PMI_703]